MKHYWLLDAGHGGLDTMGKYTTEPKRKDDKEWLERHGYAGHDVLWDTKSYAFNEKMIYEGVINRIICKRLCEKLTQHEIEWGLVYEDVVDTPLWERVQIADRVFEKDRRTVYLSIHSDKLSLAKIPNPTKQEDFVQAGIGSGCSVWTSKGQTRSDLIAETFYNTGKELLPFDFRADKSDGDYDLEGNFYVLRKTDCPAILCETGFYDNPRGAAWLQSEKGQAEYVNYLLQSILNCEKG